MREEGSAGGRYIGRGGYGRVVRESGISWVVLTSRYVVGRVRGVAWIA